MAHTNAYGTAEIDLSTDDPNDPTTAAPKLQAGCHSDVKRVFADMRLARGLGWTVEYIYDLLQLSRFQKLQPRGLRVMPASYREV